MEPSKKSRLAAFILCGILGTWGFHRFYVGKIGTGLLMILTLGGFGFWTLYDFILITIGSFQDKGGHKLTKWTE